VIKIFISHSSKDVLLVKALIDLIRSALSIPASDIRCTSVPGYKLPGGALTDRHAMPPLAPEDRRGKHRGGEPRPLSPVTLLGAFFSVYTTALVALPGAGQDVSLAHSLDVLGLLFCYGAWFCGS
jgi:hypothetical protein